MSTAANRIALVAGASGLLGGRLVEALLAAPDYGRVIALSRRPLGREHPRLANRIVQFDRLEQQLAGVACHDAFCCLGTTLARAGSEAAFRAVDVDEVLRFARVARACGAQRLVVVSAVGADPASKNFYLRTKGEMEVEVQKLGFPSVDLVQPGLLMGARAEWRPLEFAWRLVMPLANPFLVGRNSRWRGIAVDTLAQAMLGIARSGRKGACRYTWEQLVKMAASRPPAALPAAH